jgi:hypothetical protein
VRAIFALPRSVLVVSFFGLSVFRDLNRSSVSQTITIVIRMTITKRAFLALLNELTQAPRIFEGVLS